MKTFLLPKAPHIFYKFISSSSTSINFLSCLSGEDIKVISNVSYKVKENMDIECINSSDESILIKLSNGFGDYRSDRADFKESFRGYWWNDSELSCDKIYNIALMGFYVRDNHTDDSEEIIFQNDYMLKTKVKDKEVFYINIDIPYYEYSLDSTLDKWLYLIIDIYGFYDTYNQQDTFMDAIEFFYSDNYTEKEYYIYLSTLDGLDIAASKLMNSLSEGYKNSMTDTTFKSRILICKLLRESGKSLKEICELTQFPIEIMKQEIVNF